MTTASLYWHTIRHLRAAQIWGRIRHKFHKPSVSIVPPPVVRTISLPWRRCQRQNSQLGPARFSYLNVARTLSSPNDWNNPNWEKLWLYNLHYFDDLNSSDADEKKAWHRALMERWIQENPVGSGNGWEPYCLSLRIVNWIKWAWAGNPMSESMISSLATQVRFLRKRLETHLLGNHLWANLKALLFAAAYFEGEEADRWKNDALRLWRRELSEQILPDGGHFERSTMYHSIMLEDMVDLIQLANRNTSLVSKTEKNKWLSITKKMTYWLAAMTHPDGNIAFFNDAAFDIAPPPRALFDYARINAIDVQDNVDAGIVMLEPSGYVRMANADFVLIADVGEIGPSYLPGHAHADTLSFELSVHGQRLFVNAGTSRYDNGQERQWQRSTAAHNTVEIAGQDSSETWGSFRVARRARPFGLKVSQHDDEWRLTASHDGYHRLTPKATHTRTWSLTENSLNIVDFVEPKSAVAIARYRLHPNWSVAEKELRSPSQSISVTCTTGTLSTTNSTYHPSFGVTQSCEVLAAMCSSGEIAVTFTRTSFS